MRPKKAEIPPKVVVTAILVCAVPLAIWSLSDGESKASAAQVSDMPVTPLHDGPRYVISKDAEAFTDRSAVIEVLDAEKRLPSNPSDEQRLSVFKPMRQRHLAEGRRFDFQNDSIVRFIKNENDLANYCLVQEENTRRTLWVQKLFLSDASDLLASRALTGYTVFRGEEGMDIGGKYVMRLHDVIASIYDGEMTDEDASKCVFMPEAQSGEVETILDNYVIYWMAHPRDHYRKIHFAMEKHGEDVDPRRGGPIRYIRRDTFSTRNGTLRLVPILKIERGIK